MAMKLKPKDDEGISEQEKPVPAKLPDKRTLSNLFENRQLFSIVQPLATKQQQAILLQAMFDNIAMPVKPPVEVPSSPAAVPIKKDNVVPFASKRADAANDGVLPKRERGRRKGNGGNGGGFQDQCEELKSWLAAYTPIPNNVCLLRNKDKHVRASQNSERVRLVKYGDSTHRPSTPLEWKPIQKVEGWWGGRPPTVHDLVYNSRRISYKLDEKSERYKVDKETISYLRDNIGKKLYAPEENSPFNLWLEFGAVSLEHEYYVTRDISRQLLITAEYIESVDEEKSGEPTPLDKLPPLMSSCKSCVAIGSPRLLYVNSFKDERERSQRAYKRMIEELKLQFPVPYVSKLEQSYKDLEQEFDNPPSTIDEELKAYFALGDEDDSPLVVSSFEERMGMADKVKYAAWHRVRSKKNDPFVADQPYRQYRFSQLRVPRNDSEEDRSEAYSAWLANRTLFNHDNHLAENRYEQYWFRKVCFDESFRLTFTLADSLQPSPVVEERVVRYQGDVRWNMYVRFFGQYVEGELTREQLEQKAYAIWRVFWGDTAPVKVYDESGYVGMGLPTAQADNDDEWIIPPNEINRLAQESVQQVKETPYEPIVARREDRLRPEVTRKVAEASIQRIAKEEGVNVQHLSLKRAFKKLGSHFRKKKRQETTLQNVAVNDE